MKLKKRERNMTMNKREQGFTLIELIMVIVIMGILAAVVVPKFFSLELATHHKVEKAVIGNIRAGLVTYSINELAFEGKKKFPDHKGFTLSDILDEIPEDWTATSNDDSATIKYNARSDSLVQWTYKRTNNEKKYSLGNRKATEK